MDYNGSIINQDSFAVVANPGARTNQDEDTFFDDFFSTMYTYQMEFDVESQVGELPRCFSREFGDAISSYVMLRDPNNNEFEVHVLRKSKRLYFDDGWFALKDLYNIWFGAWVTFAYIDSALPTFKLTTRWGAEVEYPKHNPPVKHLLRRNNDYGVVGSSAFSASIHRSLPQELFIRSYLKKLTFYDMYSGMLILPWDDFGEYLFDYAYSNLTLIDCSGERFPCMLKFGVDPDGQLSCKISGGWVDLCTVHGFAVGDQIKVFVNQPNHNYEMYLSYYLDVSKI